MSLTLMKGLRKARSLPPFSVTTEYALTSYLCDVLSLVGEQHKATIRSVLANRLQGKALKSIETLVDPTWDQNNAIFSININQSSIFEIYLSSLSLNIKTLLIQNNITTISGAQTCFIENNLIKDVYLRIISFPNSFQSKNKIRDKA